MTMGRPIIVATTIRSGACPRSRIRVWTRIRRMVMLSHRSHPSIKWVQVHLEENLVRETMALTTANCKTKKKWRAISICLDLWTRNSATCNSSSLNSEILNLKLPVCSPKISKSLISRGVSSTWKKFRRTLRGNSISALSQAVTAPRSIRTTISRRWCLKANSFDQIGIGTTTVLQAICSRIPKMQVK